MVQNSFRLKDGWANCLYRNANEAFEQIYYGLCKEGEEVSPRGQKIRETLGGDIYILNPKDNLVFNPVCPVSPYYIAHEINWYLSADNSVESIAKYSKFWTKIANDDGTVNSNYGCYIFKKNEDGISEWDKLVAKMKRDPDTRQALLQIPVMQFMETKDVTCTMSLQFFIRGGSLFMTTYMRSNDIILGFRNDIPFFTSLQIRLANELGVNIGWYRHVTGSLHVYENHFMTNEQMHNFKSCSYGPMVNLWNDYNELMEDMMTLHNGNDNLPLHNEILSDLRDSYNKEHS